MTVTNLKIFLESNTEWTQTRVAGSIGMSVSALNAWLKGSYLGDNEKMTRAIERFLEAQKEASSETSRFKKDFDFVETSIYNDVLRSVNLAAFRGEIRVITGISGIGKSRAIEHIKEDREASMILVKVYPGMRKTRFAKKFCEAAGFGGSGTYDDMFEELSNRLEGSGRVVVIDEAEHLSIDSIDMARRINDFTGCGIVFVGLPIFYDTLQKRQRDYAYVYNRTAMPMRLQKCKASDLLAMAKTLLGETDIPDKFLLQVSGGVGRDLKFILLESLRVAEVNKIQPSDTQAFCAVIEEVRKSLGRKVA
jgi:DNA transposition AAA+ family ATPase